MKQNPAVKIDRIHPLNGKGPTKAFCDLLLLDTFIVKGLKIVQGNDGLFVGMPSSQGKDGKWHDTFHPISKETRKGLEQLILEKYSEAAGS